MASSCRMAESPKTRAIELPYVIGLECLGWALALELEGSGLRRAYQSLSYLLSSLRLNNEAEPPHAGVAKGEHSPE